MKKVVLLFGLIVTVVLLNGCSSAPTRNVYWNDNADEVAEFVVRNVVPQQRVEVAKSKAYRQKHGKENDGTYSLDATSCYSDALPKFRKYTDKFKYTKTKAIYYATARYIEAHYDVITSVETSRNAFGGGTYGYRLATATRKKEYWLGDKGVVLNVTLYGDKDAGVAGDLCVQLSSGRAGRMQENDDVEAMFHGVADRKTYLAVMQDAQNTRISWEKYNARAESKALAAEEREKERSRNSWNAIMGGVSRGLSDWNNELRKQRSVNHDVTVPGAPKRWEDMTDGERKTFAENLSYHNYRKRVDKDSDSGRKAAKGDYGKREGNHSGSGSKTAKGHKLYEYTWYEMGNGYTHTYVGKMKKVTGGELFSYSSGEKVRDTLNRKTGEGTEVFYVKSMTVQVKDRNGGSYFIVRPIMKVVEHSRDESKRTRLDKVMGKHEGQFYYKDWNKRDLISLYMQTIAKSYDVIRWF